MKIVLEKLLDLFNLIFTGFVLAYMFKPEFQTYFPYFLFMLITAYCVVAICIFIMTILESKRKNKKNDVDCDRASRVE